MRTRRDVLIVLGSGALTTTLASFAQQSAKIPRIGFLGVTTAAEAATRVEAVRAGLRDLGYVEGRNIAIEFRWADGNYERLPALAAELVRLRVDVLVGQGAPGTLAAKHATTTIPIVMGNAGEAVVTGLVASLARPGGNITGLTFLSPEVAAKRLELLKETIPRMTQLAVLLNPDNPISGPGLQAMQAVAKSLKVVLEPFNVRGPSEFEGAFSAIAKKRVGAVALVDDGMLNVNGRAVAALAAEMRLPSIGRPEFAEAGGMLGYGVNVIEQYRRVPYFVDRILKGAKPADIPVEQPTKLDLMINIKTTKMLGVSIPQAILVRANRVIE